MTDPLHDADTGLPARALGLDRLRQALARSLRSSAPVTVLHVGVRRVGGAPGDGWLRRVGDHLTSSLRLSDTVARIAPDAFLVICEGMVEMQAGALSDRLRRAVAGAGGDADTFIGIARSDSGASADALLAEAEAAAEVDEVLRRNRDDPPPPGPLPQQR